MIGNEDNIKQAERLVLANPLNVQYCQNLGEMYKELTNWKQLSSILHKEDKSQKVIANAFYNAAYLTKQKGQFELAIELYYFALDFNIEHPEEVFINLAVIYSENLRMEEKAKYLLKESLKLKKDFLPALYNLAGLFEEAGDKKLAIKYYQRIQVIEPHDADVLARLAACLNSSESSQLIKPLQYVLQLGQLSNAQKIQLNYALGKILDDAKCFGAAFTAYTEANRLDGIEAAHYSPEIQEAYIDANIEFFNKSWFENLPVISTVAPIFICGMFRSGSTLLEQILSSHSDITAGGELDFFDSFIKRNEIDFPHDIKKFSEKDLTLIADHYIKDIENKFPDASLLTDKRPDNFLYIGLIKSLFPNAQVIHTKRDIRDNCIAIYFQQLDRKLNYATSLTNIKHYYEQQQRLMNHWESLFGDDFHVINYEELVKSPEASTNSIFLKIGKQWQKQCAKFYLNDNSVKTASIWQVRQPLHQDSCNRWYNYKDEIKYVLK